MSNKRLHTFWAVALIIATIIGLPMLILIINNRPVKFTVPTPAAPNPNGWDDFKLAGKMIGKTRNFGPYSDASRQPEEWKLPELKAFAQANKSALDVVRTGLDKPYLHPTLRSYEDMPFYPEFREMGRILCGEARYYDVSGKPGEAADSLLDCIELGVTLPRGGILLTGLAGITIEAIGITPLATVVPKLNQDDLAKAAKRIKRIQAKRVPFSEIIIEEGNFDVSSLIEVINKPSANSYIDPRNWKNGLLGDDKWANARFAFANKTALVRSLDRYYKDLAADQSGCYTGKSHVSVPNVAGSDVLINDEIIVRAHGTYICREAMLTLIQTEIALRRYRADQGQYPKSLDKLAPKYLKSVPIDPFGQGKPLKYRLIDNGKRFLLYSVGSDLKDDGGKPTNWGKWNEKGDLVDGKSGKSNQPKNPGPPPSTRP